jgi:hypothetical protein
MGEPLPPKSDSTGIPGFSPLDGSVKSVGRRTAKLALWSPFVGLFLMFVLGYIAGNGDDVSLRSGIAIYASCSLFFAGGLVLGIKALRRMKTEGRKGILGRALTGMVLNGLLLCVSICLTGICIYVSELLAKQKEKEASDNQKYEAAMKGLNLGFGLQVKKIQTQYESSWAALTNPSVLDMAAVENKEELKLREKKVAEFVAACNAFREFSENPTEVYRQELLKQPLSPKARERLLKDFAKSNSGKNPQIIALRQADVRRGEALLNVVTFLGATWGQWEYFPATKEIRFKRTAEAEEYETDLKEFSTATDEALRLKEQMTPN